MSACNQNDEHPYAQNIEGIDDFPYEFKLPTHMPYEVERVKLFHYDQRTEELPEKSSELEPLDFNLEISLLGTSEEEIVITQIEPELGNRTGSNEQQLELSNGTEAKYFYNGSSQILTWNDSGLSYDIIVYLPEQDNELYSVEELIKIANSFATYYRP
ncbi:hypothetical protein J2R98_000750 [Alkalibacillus filiformis]|uniref:DUF4367 domain-containing protein n=1 Tax=Alkalibacillus filiformis TaxID=200990 RepID=A0ABU0DR73_9BACI|nr:hypothetical protein [Alkalibacillus filiformis]